MAFPENYVLPCRLARVNKRRRQKQKLTKHNPDPRPNSAAKDASLESRRRSPPERSSPISPKPKASAARLHPRANSPECRQLIAEFVGDEWEEMRAVFYRSMRAIEHALSARREYLTKEGQIMQGGPDHYARLAATKHFRDFLMASRPAPKQPEPKR